MNPNRLWFYFRHGYAYYIASVLAPINSILILVGLRDQFGLEISQLYIILPLIVIVGIPGIILVGRTHYKKAFKHEMDITHLNNPYHFKAIPQSKEMVIILPVLLEMVRYLKILGMDSDRKKRLEGLEDSIIQVINGGSTK